MATLEQEITLTKEQAIELQEQSGNIRILEHINLSNMDKCSEQAPVYAFYVKGLQCTRDPRLAYHFWMNFGRNQFHLFTGQDHNENINGAIYLFVPDLDEIEKSLASVRDELQGTHFAFERINRGGATTRELPREKWQLALDLDAYDHIKANDPYGSELRLLVTPRHYWSIYKSLGGMLPTDGVRDGVPQGMPFIVYPVRPGIAHGIARFFEYYLAAKTVVTKQSGANSELFTTHVSCGPLQTIVFVEDAAQRENLGEYDGHHLCIHIDRFKECYDLAFNEKMNWNNLHFFDRCDTWFDANRDQQYRILHIIDPVDKKFLLSFELEIRSAQHFRNIVYRADSTPEQEAENELKRQKHL
ncbi:hypothetical protein PybrP1_008894 [[Pythium] brassicae (nom. inval.)]|nr:hypothetical protein PybrP1_008894 [[Pythium] brassicae (nom. inval.)]